MTSVLNPVLILVRNQLAITRECLESVFAQTLPVEVFVINNASQECAPYLNSLYRTHRNIHIIHNYPGWGVAASWNQGLSALFANSEHVLVANNDTILSPWTYESLLDHGGTFVTGVGVTGEHYNEFKHGVKVFKDNIGTEVFPGDGVGRGERPHPDYSLWLMRKSVWETVGPFDEEFKGGFVEDASHHLSMFRAGINAVCIDLPFYHVGSGTIKASSPEEQERISKQANANRALFLQKFGVEVGSKEYYALFGQTSVPEDSKFVTVESK